MGEYKLVTYNAFFLRLAVFIILWVPCNIFGQSKQDFNPQEFISAQELYLNGDFETSLSMLISLVEETTENKGSIEFLRIMCLHQLYKRSNTRAMELELALTSYFNEHSIENTPIYEFENIVAVLLELSVFQAKDHKAMKDFSIPLSGNDTTLYKQRIQAINNYLNKNIHSYHRDTLSNCALSFSDSLSRIMRQYEQIQFDEKCWKRLHQTGKFSTFELGYNFYPGIGNYRTISNMSDIEPFLSQGESGHPLSMPEQSFDISAFNIGFNLPHNKRWKISILYSVFSFGLQKWLLENDSVILRSDGETGANYLVNLNFGSKVGIMNSFLITPELKLGVYYNFNPALSFFNETYSFINNEPRLLYIVQNKEKIIFRHELGLRFYTSANFYLGICYQFGEYGWLNSISEVSDASGKEQLSSRIPYQLIGARIGF